MIRAGRVVVDGEIATLGQKVDPESARVLVDGIPLPLAPDHVVYLLNKPAGVISTADDPQGRATVVDLVPADPRVYPIGRLDADTEGLLLLTNDGELTHRLTHPSFGATKTYLAFVEGDVGDKALRRLRRGIDLEDGPARAVSASVQDRHGGRSLVEVVMGEGRKREVRRMFDAVGHRVVRLARTEIAGLRDVGLAPGEWRRLRIEEIRSLYSATDGTWEDDPRPQGAP
jgi:23S rRNA pseudouridine2605 synthase